MIYFGNYIYKIVRFSRVFNQCSKSCLYPYITGVSGFYIQFVVCIFLFVPSLSPEHLSHLPTRYAALPDFPLLGNNTVTRETQKLSVILDNFLSPITFNNSPSWPPTSNINSSSKIFLDQYWNWPTYFLWNLWKSPLPFIQCWYPPLYLSHFVRLILLLHSSQ